MTHTFTRYKIGFGLLFLLSALSSQAADTWKVISPLPKSQVKSGELFMAVEYNKELKLQHNSVQIFLDGYLVTNNVKITEGKISLLYLLPLKPGRHTFEVQASAYKHGWLDALKWDFTVAGLGPEGSSSQDTGVRVKKSKFEVQGNMSAQYRGFFLSGDGQGLRQGQPYMGTFSLDAVAKAGKVSFPVHCYTTSDQYTYTQSFQSRNYFQVGMVTRWLDARYGDMNPNFDRLAVTGMRVHGYKVELKRKRSSIQVIDGYLQQAKEGDLSRYYNMGPPPPTLRPDSMYVTPGVFKRRITAGRLSFGNKEEGSSIGINFLKVKDDVKSISYGTDPKDNLVMSYDQTVVTSDSRMRFNGGIAFSLFTEDISSGALEKKTIDSIYGTDLPVNPASYKKFLIINATTRQPTKQSLAGYVNATFKQKNNSVLIEYRYIGGAYTSLANPYLRNDLRGGTIQDQAYFLKRKLIFTARYNIQISNLSESQFSFINSHLGSASMLIMPSRKLPQLSLFYNFQWRINPPQASKLIEVNDQLNAYGANLNYTLQAFKSYHSVNLQYFRNIRNDVIFPTNNSSITNLSAGINELITPISLGFDLQYNKMLYTTGGGETYPLYDVLTSRLRYSWKKLKSEFSVAMFRNHYFDTPLSQAAERNTYSGTYTGKFIHNMVFELEGGTGPFLNAQDTRFSYNESYFLVRLLYDFHIK